MEVLVVVKQPTLTRAEKGIITKLVQPTSVRFGRGPNFDQAALFVTEGGGIVPNIDNRRVVQVSNPFRVH
jgi:hypothetical protein